ncbi:MULTISPECIES: SRPBCC family protein [Flagellimonas]|uniref:SRPBCC family protein n=1 Tax=Flagellimonas hadalis TaxID=2597517 RepID=A0A5N5IZS3_9FLAO|nr:SRPBCC family protein [Allomuricauda hadalis]KAB5491566.1 SRPBCC family protein [Allomuricauda hadalis]RUA16866.1 MAG: cell division inhibitor [Flavobacteriia bacterium]
MKLYQLRSIQVLPISIEEAWEFLSDPKNLQVITPSQMGFHILSGAEKSMHAGQIIQYIVKPFPFMTTRWVTEITHVREGSYFVDEQRFGPYALWHHKHFLKPVDQGVEMEDVIDYKLPLGFIGALFHPILVKKQLLEIFRYRERKLSQLFGTIHGENSSLTIKTI